MRKTIKFTIKELIKKYKINDDNEIFIKADGNDYEIKASKASKKSKNKSMKQYYIILHGKKSGDLTVRGNLYVNIARVGKGRGDAMRSGGDGDSVRNGKGVGCAYVFGKGNGNAVRLGAGPGDAVKDGKGSGDAVFHGDIVGNAIRVGSGQGDAVHSSETAKGSAIRGGSGIGNSFRSGNNKGHAINETTNQGVAARLGLGYGNAIRSNNNEYGFAYRDHDLSGSSYYLGDVDKGRAICGTDDNCEIQRDENGLNIIIIDGNPVFAFE